MQPRRRRLRRGTVRASTSKDQGRGNARHGCVAKPTPARAGHDGAPAGDLVRVLDHGVTRAVVGLPRGMIGHRATMSVGHADPKSPERP